MEKQFDLKLIIKTFETLKKYTYIIDRGTLGKVIVNFKDENFFHLLKSKSKKYQYIKSKPEKFNTILENQIKEKTLLQYRMSTFNNILDLLNGDNVTFYEFREQIPGSQFNGDYGILKIYESLNCLLGLRISSVINNITNSIPISWMASNRSNKLVEFKRPSFINKITAIPKELYNEEYLLQ